MKIPSDGRLFKQGDTIGRRDAAEVGCRDPDKVQHFSTFMNMTVLDYAERTRVDYESWMAEKYGPN